MTCYCQKDKLNLSTLSIKMSVRRLWITFAWWVLLFGSAPVHAWDIWKIHDVEGATHSEDGWQINGYDSATGEVTPVTFISDIEFEKGVTDSFIDPDTGSLILKSFDSEYTSISVDGIVTELSELDGSRINYRSEAFNVEEDGTVSIGENSLRLREENGRQKMWAADAKGNLIPINITEGSDLLVSGVSVMGSIEESTEDIENNRQNISTNAGNIETNRQNISTNAGNIETNRKNISTNAGNIETNRKNINDLGYGVAGATALTAALSSLPTAADDTPFSCGVGTGGYSSRFAVGIGCASRLSDRLSVNVGGSHVFGGSSSYGGGSLDTVAARGGFVFKLGTIHKRSNIDGEELQSQLDELKRENSSIREENKAVRDENRAIRDENKELIARLERLEAIALGRKSSITRASLK